MSKYSEFRHTFKKVQKHIEILRIVRFWRFKIDLANTFDRKPIRFWNDSTSEKY